MSIKIIVDSTTDLKDEIRDKVITVPLTVSFGDEEYVDGVTITHEEFYEKLISGDVMPKTSQVSPGAFSEVFEREAADGSTLIVLTISSKISGTYQSALIAAKDFNNVFVVDSKNLTISVGILVELALKHIEDGMGAEKLVETLCEEREKIYLLALFDTLKYLKHGGRISKTSALIGGMLSIKPIVSVRNGDIVVLGKARGTKQGYNLLIKEIEKSKGIDFKKPILFGYTGLSDSHLSDFINDSSFLWDGKLNKYDKTIVGSVVGTHAGPDAVAVVFFEKE